MATLTVDNVEPGNPCPPSLFAAKLDLIGSAQFAGKLPVRSWDTDPLATGAELVLTSLGSPPISETGGEEAHETCNHTIEFNGFSGSLGTLRRPYKWRDARLEATVQAQSNDKECDDFFKQVYEPADRAALQLKFRDFYSLPKNDNTFGFITGLKETITLFVGGKKIASEEGIVTHSSDRFHRPPDRYTVKFRPFRVRTSTEQVR